MIPTVPLVTDFKEHLGRQMRFIERSCKLYDDGHFEEALRVATAARVMFHNSGNSTSILKHLNAESSRLLSTAAPFVEEPTMHNHYLVKWMATVNGVDDIRYQCEPLLADSIRQEEIPFESWWREPIIEHKEPEKTLLTRRDLVLAAANKDGGVHVDEKLHPVYDYARLGSGLSLQFFFQPQWNRPPLQLPIENVHYASLRQIGYEILHSSALIALAAK